MPWFFLLDVSALGVSMILASALALLAISANPRGRLNIAFSLFALSEASWAVCSMLLRLGLWLERGDPLFLSACTGMSATAMAVLLLAFVALFVKRQNRVTRGIVGCGLVFLFVIAYPMFTGQIITDAYLEVNGATSMRFSQFGIVIAMVPMLFMAGALGIAWLARRQTEERFILFSLLVIFSGFLFGGLLNLPLPILSLTNTIGLGILGFGVAHRQVFNPLKQRTQQLEQGIEKRARIQAELEASEERFRKLNTDLEIRVKSRTAALEATNAELQAFAYSVSHDLRAPLRAINGFSRALSEDLGDTLAPEQQRYLDRMHQASVRMSQMIDDLLKLSRAAQSELNLQPVNITALAEDVARELHDGNPEKAISVSVEPDLCAHADPTLLRAILENLMGNAWKFSGDTIDPKISICLERRDGKPVFVVRDNGIGFEMKYSEKIFRPFERLHSQGEYEGAGIGLATVRRIIRRHGGHIWAESEPGSGSRFYFTLPPADMPLAASDNLYNP